jgi:RNA polymerase sporulation-specific sigma factor
MTETNDYSITSDEELSLLAQKGDENALNKLLCLYKPLVSKIARSYFLVGGDIEDIMQEGMIGLYKAIMHYSGDKASFKTFATTCIKHQIQSAIRIASSDKNKPLSSAMSIAEKTNIEDDEEIEILIPSPLPSPDDEVLEKEKLEEIRKIIKNTLSPLEIKILSLYLKGFSYKEISEMANITTKSIDNGLTRIKNKLSFLKK